MSLDPAVPSHIAYYISSHGYGHATRAIQLCHAFLQAHDALRITVVSQASSHIFLPLLNASMRVSLRPVHIDSAVVQPSPYRVEVEVTVDNLLRLHAEQDEIATRESEWLRTHHVDLVLSDAPYIASIAASNAGCMNILITNFSFAEVFSYFHNMVEPQVQDRLKEAVDAVVKGYSLADVWLRLPGSLPNPGFLSVELPSSAWVTDQELHITAGDRPNPEHSSTCPQFARQIIDTPLITRPSTTSPRVDVMKSLGIPDQLWNHRILLLLLPPPSPPPQVPSDWVCLVAGSTPTDLLPDRYFVAPSDIHIPDVMKISSCVMAKLGYGTVSEVLAADVPVVYIPRCQFIEEYGLRELVEKWSGYEGRAERLEINDYEKGYWWWVVTELADRPKMGNQDLGPTDDGDTLRRLALDQWRTWQSFR
ncbi:L-arabinokinase [Drechslerella dactyloides]|uniref:L-arabinokinase n=1 Tax=Drechslerella dactyloides TaxID=74499 RepID=A0AAD6J8Q6_DREDA|nr:L-arabinokinase [Drechslerella dactyloides]